MHPGDCPAWEYKHHPKSSELGARCARILVALRGGAIPQEGSTRDTRSLHHSMFVGLTPIGCGYFAGHYRGEKFRCLEHYEVVVQGDPRVGTPAQMVSLDLANFSDHVLRAGLAALRRAYDLPDSRLPPEEKLIFLVTFACRVLVEFLRIHPYANGNGHIGRLVVWLLLSRFGYWPKRWPLNTSPPYHQLLSDYRSGSHEPLEKFVLNCVVGK